jgi:OPA family glycerol-3-phosphate transporter-like MFS transporter 3
MGAVDSVFLFFYAIGLYIGGNLEDKFSIRLVMPIGMLGSAVATFFIAFLGWSQAANRPLYAGLWAINGLCQAVVWPGTVAIIGNWFNENSRGIAMGAFSSSANGGNVLGSLLAVLVLVVMRAQWFILTFLSSVIMILIALAFLIFGRDKPTGGISMYVHDIVYTPV